VKHSSPNKPPTEEKEQDLNKNVSQENKMPETKGSEIDSKKQTQYTYDKINYRSPTFYACSNLIIMILIFIVTGIYAVFAGLQWKTMQNQLALADRPWLKIELEISGPLKFIKFGEKTAIRTIVQIKIKNIGRSVAKNIRLDCQIFIPPLFSTGYRFDEVNFQKDIFNKLTTERMHPLDEGHCIFPDDETILTKNLDYFIKESDFINIEGFAEIEGHKFLPGYLYPLLVICCVDYQFYTSPGHHQTGVIDRIVQTTPFPEGASGPTINNAKAIKVSDEIPVNELKIIRYGLAGRQAN
jgi:hypothetical protein